MNETDALWLGLSSDDLVVLGASIGVFAVVLALSFSTTSNDRLAARLKAVSEPDRARSAGGASSESAPRGRAAMIALMRGIVQRLNLLRSRNAKDAATRLARAGWRSKDALVIYLFCRLSMPLLAGGGALFWLYGLELFHLEPMIRLVAVLACVLLGFVAPNVVVRNFADRRRDKLRKALPDTLDLMVICTEAGLSLDASLARVTREIGSTAPEIADELSVVLSELSYLGDRKEALDNFRARVDLAPVQALCTTLLQTEKFGTPLAQALRVLASELRDDRMLRAEEKAARLPAIMTIPLILFILPALFVVVMGPAVLSIMDALIKM